MNCIFSVDVEDWFHILDLPAAPKIETWDSLPSRVENNFKKLLELFEEHQTKATCFFLGWVAKKFPHLVKEAARRGHEVASHGFSHRLAYEMGEKDFFEDVQSSKKTLEDITGKPVAGYRAAGFSLTQNTPWFFARLAEAGYRYDSSLFPTWHGHGGLNTGRLAPHVVEQNGARILEFPITAARVFGQPLCFFGGGYLRLFPYSLIRKMARKVLSEGRPVIFYIHPREIDPAHPRLPMNFFRRWQAYINLNGTAEKIGKILNDFEITNFETFIAENPITANP